MHPIELQAHAKINLTLEVLGKRPDGYHEIASIIQTIGLYDTLTLELADELTLETDTDSLRHPMAMVQMRRQAAGALGIISSVGAFGGFIVPLAYAWSKSQFGNIQPALQFYVGFFLLLLVVTWFFYIRKSTRMGQVGV